MTQEFTALIDQTNKCLVELNDKYGIKESIIIWHQAFEKLANEDIEAFLWWICDGGVVEVKHSHGQRKTDPGSFSVSIKKGLIWKHLGSVETKPRSNRKSRGRGNWMANALVSLVKHEMAKKDAAMIESGHKYVEQNALLMYCMENKLFSQEDHDRISRIFGDDK